MTEARSHEAETTEPEPPAAAADVTGAEPDDLRLRTMAPQDLSFVVREHRRHFPDGFFARLGPRFLREYYRAFLTASAARTTIAEVGGERAGYLVGVTDPTAHREHLVRRHGRTLVRRAVASMLTHPSLAWCFVRTRLGLYVRKLLRYARRLLRRRGTAPATASGGSDPAPAVLAHVAVVPEAQSQGIGSALIRRFHAQVAAAGRDRLTLVTLSGEDGAGPYYEHRGWEPLGERQTPDGLVLTTYERPVEATGGEQAEPSGSDGTA
jgi:ribosomal protein S18 acetylase RimI-like enzyme